MKRILVSDKEAENLAKRERRRIEGYRRRHLKRKRSYVNDERLGALMKRLQTSFNYVLFSIPFRSPFSFYLFLYLKDKTMTTEIPQVFDIPALYSNKFFSFPVEVRFAKIAKELGFTRNCVKYAFRELISIGLVMDVTEEYLPEHLSAKTCVVFNDENILYYDSQKEKVCYAVQKSRIQDNSKVLNYGQIKSQQSPIDFGSVKR